jgi:hypothetical protein
MPRPHARAHAATQPIFCHAHVVMRASYLHLHWGGLFELNRPKKRYACVCVCACAGGLTANGQRPETKMLLISASSS